MACSAMSVRAQSASTCDILNEVAELPAALIAARLGEKDTMAFKRQIGRAQRGLMTARGILSDDPGDLEALWSVLRQVKRSWRHRHESDAAGKDPRDFTIGAALHDRFIAVFDKFGCEVADRHGRAGLIGFASKPVGVVTIALVVLGITLVVYGFMRMNGKRRAKRHVCTIPALVRHDGICTVTTVVDFGRGGAKVRVPEGGFGSKALEVHMTGMSIPARVAWSNEHFAGLSFARTLDKSVVKSIMRDAKVQTRPEGLTNRAPSCFAVGCHVGCATHCAPVVDSKGAAPG